MAGGEIDYERSELFFFLNVRRGSIVFGWQHRDWILAIGCYNCAVKLGKLFNFAGGNGLLSLGLVECDLECMYPILIFNEEVRPKAEFARWNLDDFGLILAWLVNDAVQG